MSKITYAFVNSDDPPISSYLEGYVIYKNISYIKTLQLYGIYTVTYDHPDVPGRAQLPVMERHLIKEVDENDKDYAPIYLAFQAQETLKLLKL